MKDLVIAHRRQWGWRFVNEFCWRKTDNGVPGGWGNRFKNAIRGGNQVRNSLCAAGLYGRGQAQEKPGKLLTKKSLTAARKSASILLLLLLLLLLRLPLAYRTYRHKRGKRMKLSLIREGITEIPVLERRIV